MTNSDQESHEDYCKRMTEKYGEDWADDDFYDDPSEDFLIRIPKSQMAQGRFDSVTSSCHAMSGALLTNEHY